MLNTEIQDFLKKVIAFDTEAIEQMIKIEPYASNLIELLSYQYFNNKSMLAFLCHKHHENVFLSVASHIPMSLWLDKNDSGGSLLLYAMVSGSMPIFDCVYNTGLFNILDFLHCLKKVDSS